MIIRVSLIVIASIAALKISLTKINSALKSQANKTSESSHLEHKFEEKENTTANANHETQKEEKKNFKIEEFEDSKVLIGCEKMDYNYITEKGMLENLIQNYKQREEGFERKLIKLNRLKKDKSDISQLKMKLEKKTEKLESLKKTIASLQSESKFVHEKIREDCMFKMQLQIANKIINEMESKKDVNGSHLNDHILMLQQQLDELQKYNGFMVNEKHEYNNEDIELEVLEMKRRNKELELEKREVGTKLATAQARVRTEETEVAQMQEEITDLQHVNEELSEQVEILQRNRFDMVQELVYQTWLFTCLKFEVHNHNKKQIRKPSKQECNLISDKELYNKTHSFTSDSEVDTISSYTTLNDSDETETTTIESSSSSQSSSIKNFSFLNKIKRWKKTKDYDKKILSKGRNSPSRPGPIRRFSMSMVESELSKRRNCSGGGDDSPVMNIEKPMSRLKRVSFSDSVKKSTYQVMQEEVEDENEKNSEMTSTITFLEENMAKEHYDKVKKSKEYVVCNHVNIDSSAVSEGSNNKDQIGHLDELYSKNELVCREFEKIKSLPVQLLLLFFFLVIFLAYLRFK